MSSVVDNSMKTAQTKWWQNLSGFDYFVFAGAAINILVISYLFGYWLLFG